LAGIFFDSPPVALKPKNRAKLLTTNLLECKVTPFCKNQRGLRSKKISQCCESPPAAPTTNNFDLPWGTKQGSLFQEIIAMANDVKGSVLVVGGGIAGMQSALDLANSGYYVYLLEKSPSIGGVMSQLDKTFPTNDCAM
jgi:heterodisulfide reductase subunit A-like polyferredoxin